MADKLTFESLSDVRLVLTSAAGTRWRTTTSALEAHADGSWASYLIAPTRLGTSATVQFTVPATLPAGQYTATVYSGAAPAVTAEPVGVVVFYWDGVNAIQANARVETIDATERAAVGVAVWNTGSGLIVGGSSGIFAENSYGHFFTHRVDDRVSTRAAATALPVNFGTLAIANNAVAGNITRVAGTAVASIAEFRADLTALTDALSALDGKVDGAGALTVAIKAVTDKLDTALQADGEGGFQLTATAVELAPTGGGGGPGGWEPEPGAIEKTLTVLNDDNAGAVGGARCWITSTPSPSAAVVLSNLFTNGNGVVRVIDGTAEGAALALLEGDYYLHSNKPGTNLLTPVAFSVEAEA
jgi:hypothetical protein